MNRLNQYEIDKQRMKEAIEYAMVHSENPKTKSGCSIYFDDTRLPAFGTNRLPIGVIPEPWMFEYPEIYDTLDHAEADAIHRYKGFVKDGTLYINWNPCMPCARMMLNARIKRVVIHKEGQEAYEKLSGQNPSEINWHKIDSIDFMRKAGIQVDVMSFNWNGQVKGMFRGTEVSF